MRLSECVGGVLEIQAAPDGVWIASTGVLSDVVLPSVIREARWDAASRRWHVPGRTASRVCEDLTGSDFDSYLDTVARQHRIAALDRPILSDLMDVQVRLEDDCWSIQTLGGERIDELFRSIGAGWDPRAKRWSVPFDRRDAFEAMLPALEQELERLLHSVDGKLGGEPAPDRSVTPLRVRLSAG